MVSLFSNKTLPHSSALPPKIAKTSGGVAVADSECIWQILTARKMRQKQLKHIKTTVKSWKIQQGLEIFAVAPEGDFLFLRHHNRFGDGVDRHGGSRSGHGSWGLKVRVNSLMLRQKQVSDGFSDNLRSTSSMNHQWIINMFAELGNMGNAPCSYWGLVIECSEITTRMLHMSDTLRMISLLRNQLI